MKYTFGERLADRVALFGGSWKFLILFAIFLFLWMAINAITFIWRPFDPYPYIFLNLILSCLAAMQAPVIMMSQNRQAAKDRQCLLKDLDVDMKCLVELKIISNKLDILLK